MSKTMSNQDLSNRLRKFMTGDDGHVGVSEERLALAWKGVLSMYFGAAGGRCGLVVSVFDSKKNAWNPCDVIAVENTDRPGINTRFHVWNNRDQLFCESRWILETLRDEYCEPAKEMSPFEVIEECRKVGVLIDVFPTLTRYVVDVQVGKCRVWSATCEPDEVLTSIKIAAVTGLGVKHHSQSVNQP